MRRRLALLAVLLAVPGTAAAADPKMLVYAGINFTLYVLLLFFVLRKPLREFLAGRAAAIEAEMRRVADAKADLVDRIDGLKARCSQIDAEAQAIRDEAARIADGQATRLAEDAAQQAAGIRAATELRVGGIARDLQHEILTEAADLLIARTLDSLAGGVDAAADERIVRHGLLGLEGAQ
jgi:F-type H+-transporting ATPase subunit b